MTDSEDVSLTPAARDALDTVLDVIVTAAHSELAPYMDGDRVDGFLAALSAVDPPLRVAVFSQEDDRPPSLDVERLARAMHDSVWSGHWLHDFGAECPDGETDANAWRTKAIETAREYEKAKR